MLVFVYRVCARVCILSQRMWLCSMKMCSCTGELRRRCANLHTVRISVCIHVSVCTKQKAKKRGKLCHCIALGKFMIARALSVDRWRCAERFPLAITISSFDAYNELHFIWTSLQQTGTFTLSRSVAEIATQMCIIMHYLRFGLWLLDLAPCIHIQIEPSANKWSKRREENSGTVRKGKKRIAIR